MIDKGIRIKCDRCGHEEFKVVEFDDDEIDISVNLCGDLGNGWIGVHLPELNVLCKHCVPEFKERIAAFIDYCT